MWTFEMFSRIRQALTYTAFIFDIGYPLYDQLTPVKTMYLLTSITWLYWRLRFRAHWGHIMLPWGTGFSIGSQNQVKLIYCYQDLGFQAWINLYITLPLYFDKLLSIFNLIFALTREQQADEHYLINIKCNILYFVKVSSL